MLIQLNASSFSIGDDVGTQRPPRAPSSVFSPKAPMMEDEQFVLSNRSTGTRCRDRYPRPRRYVANGGAFIAAAPELRPRARLGCGRPCRRYSISSVQPRMAAVGGNERGGLTPAPVSDGRPAARPSIRMPAQQRRRSIGCRVVPQRHRDRPAAWSARSGRRGYVEVDVRSARSRPTAQRAASGTSPQVRSVGRSLRPCRSGRGSSLVSRTSRSVIAARCATASR